MVRIPDVVFKIISDVSMQLLILLNVLFFCPVIIIVDNNDDERYVALLMSRKMDDVIQPETMPDFSFGFVMIESMSIPDYFFARLSRHETYS